MARPITGLLTGLVLLVAAGPLGMDDPIASPPGSSDAARSPGGGENKSARSHIKDNVAMGDERIRSEIRDEQERIISAVASARDHWEMAKAEDSFADLLERMADELQMRSAHDRGRFLAAAHALRQLAVVNEQRYITGLSPSPADT